MQTIAPALVLVAAGALGACSSEALGSADGGLDAGAPDSGGLFAGPTIGPDFAEALTFEHVIHAIARSAREDCRIFLA